MDKNKVWTSDDLRELKTLLRVGKLKAAAARLDRPVREVEEMARDCGWIESHWLRNEQTVAELINRLFSVPSRHGSAGRDR